MTSTSGVPHLKSAVAAGESPFSLANESVYRRWRERKLKDYPTTIADLRIEVRDPQRLTDAEVATLLATVAKTNMAIYGSQTPADKGVIGAVAARVGLQRLTTNPLADEDGVSSLQVSAEKSGRGYIPYSNKRLLWHTDGYYNPPAETIRAFILHCASPAAEGGENALLDHEIAYLLLREADPDYIRALMAPDAMTIPANTEPGMAAVRPASIGPVFSLDSRGNLHMRYTARTRSIEWKQDTATAAAVQFLEQLLANDTRYVFRYRLAAGEGLICNNVLHNRTEFRDDAQAKRLIYRARYYDRVADSVTYAAFK